MIAFRHGSDPLPKFLEQQPENDPAFGGESNAGVGRRHGRRRRRCGGLEHTPFQVPLATKRTNGRMKILPGSQSQSVTPGKRSAPRLFCLETAGGMSRFKPAGEDRLRKSGRHRRRAWRKSDSPQNQIGAASELVLNVLVKNRSSTVAEKPI